MVYLLRHGPGARRSSRNMQAADSRPGLFSNVVERDRTSRARRPTLPCATRAEPRESDFSGCPRWVRAPSPPAHTRPQPAEVAPRPILTAGANWRRLGKAAVQPEGKGGSEERLRAARPKHPLMSTKRRPLSQPTSTGIGMQHPCISPSTARGTPRLQPEKRELKKVRKRRPRPRPQNQTHLPPPLPTKKETEPSRAAVFIGRGGVARKAHAPC